MVSKILGELPKKLLWCALGSLKIPCAAGATDAYASGDVGSPCGSDKLVYRYHKGSSLRFLVILPYQLFSILVIESYTSETSANSVRDRNIKAGNRL